MTAPISVPPPTGSPESNRRRWWEIGIVLGLSLGASAVYSIVSIIAKLTLDTKLSDQSAAINQSQSTREWLDFTYQFLGLFFQLVPVALVIYLLWQPARSGFARIGLDLRSPGRDFGRGLLLFAVIGIPGIGVYALGRALGLTVAVVPAPLDTYWWTVPILVFSAIRAGLQEEVIVVGYLFAKLREIGWNTWTIILSTSVLRGSYHLYQGIGPFFGNVAMGVVFGWCYQRWGRVMPLVVAHAIIDIVSFVGYPLAAAWWPGLFVPVKP
ncbi:CPBP family intramembrane glutamic endopeptidase [Plantibacter sp. YIM 135249]|uniref:CPBP family intramembrane glutamic endopeptidase n=1 Tax=Plantibacter sp. YIM 135249 TaxID=3423918 RepID=UPI003D33D75B